MKSLLMRFFSLLFCALATIQVSQADLLVSDNFGGQIIRYTFDSNGVQNGASTFITLDGATGMRINPLNGELLVTSQGLGLINRYNAQTGQLLGVFASGLAAPSDIKVGPDGNLYVANFASNSISVFNQNGTLQNTLGGLVGGPGNPNFLAWDSSNRLYVSSFNDDAVYRYNTNTSSFDVFASGNGLNGATGIAFKGNQLLVSSVYPVNPNSGEPTKILAFNADGSFASDFTVFTSYPNPQPTYPPYFEANPSDIVPQQDGSFLVALLGQGQVARVSSTGTYLGPYVMGGGIVTPTQILEVAAVPEPATWGALALLAGSAWCWKRRRRV
jgi:hypothetical protein